MSQIIAQLVDQARADIEAAAKARHRQPVKGSLLDTPAASQRRAGSYSVQLIAIGQLLAEEIGVLRARDILHAFADQLPIMQLDRALEGEFAPFVEEPDHRRGAA